MNIFGIRNIFGMHNFSSKRDRAVCVAAIVSNLVLCAYYGLMR